MSSEKEPAPYIRRRAYNKIHVTSWIIYLYKNGFVRCSFKNCNFMAFDVEEMCDHYGFCTGDNSTAKYICEYCNGCTNDKNKLELHLERSHNVIKQATGSTESNRSPEPTEKVKPSRVLMQAWTYFFEQYNYIKCLTCAYLANTLTDMCRHHLVCKSESKLLLYVCSECKGRTINVNPLLWHLERSHKIFKAPNQFNHITKSMIKHWQGELKEKGYASCLHITRGKRDCFYFDHKSLGIIEHSQSCKGPNFATPKEECPFCPMWTSNAEVLQHHIDLSNHIEEVSESEGTNSAKGQARNQSLNSISNRCSTSTYLKNNTNENTEKSFTVTQSDKERDNIEPGKALDVSSDEEIQVLFTEEKNNEKDIITVDMSANEKEKIYSTSTTKEKIIDLKKNTGTVNFISPTQQNRKVDMTLLKTKNTLDNCDNKEMLHNKLPLNNTDDHQEEDYGVANIKMEEGIEIHDSQSYEVSSSKGDTSGLSLQSLQQVPISQVNRNIKQMEIFCQDTEKDLRIKNQGHDKKNQNKSELEIEEICETFRNQNCKRKDTGETPQQKSTIENTKSDFLNKRHCNENKSNKTIVRKRSSSTTTQGNSISINILNDWIDSDDSDSIDDSIQAEDVNEIVVMDEDVCVEKKNGKEVYEQAEKLEHSQIEKLRKAQTKQPCLFEDMSDDDNTCLSEEESGGNEVTMDVSFDNQGINDSVKVLPKNYLKRKSSSFRPSTSKCHNTPEKLNVRNVTGLTHLPLFLGFTILLLFIRSSRPS